MARAFDLITFDFDGVLLHNNYNELFLDHCRTLGLGWAPEQERVLARFIHDYFGSGRSRADMEAHGQEGFWAVAYLHFLETLGAEGDVAAAAASLAEAMQAAEGVYYHEYGLHEMLDGLREAGYHLAMLTNRDDRIHEFGKRVGIDRSLRVYRHARHRRQAQAGAAPVPPHRRALQRARRAWRCTSATTPTRTWWARRRQAGTCC